MAKPQLNELIEWLQLNERNRFEIYDADRNKAITKSVSYKELTANGTPEDYFSRLLEKGVGTVQIVQKKKNGSSFSDRSCGHNFSLTTEADNNVAASGAPVRPAATPQQLPNFGLMGNASPGFGGLGFPELMSMSSKAERYQETKLTADQLQQKVEKLTEDNIRLDRENFVLQNDLKREKESRQEEKDKEPSTIDKLVKAVIDNPTLIPHLAAVVKGGGNPAGLNAPQQAPQQESGLSETQKLVIDTIKNNSDQHVTAAYYVLAMAEQKNDEFLKKYHKLLTEFNLIQDGSNS